MKYEPRKFSDLNVGDTVYMVNIHGQYPSFSELTVKSITDVELQYPERHWKEFVLDENEDNAIKRSMPTRNLKISIFGFFHGAYQQKYCTYYKIYSDRKFAINSYNTYLKELIKKNTRRLEILTERLKYQNRALSKLHDKFSEDDLTVK